MFSLLHFHTQFAGFKSTNAAQEKHSAAATVPASIEKEKDEDTSSDVASEAGTYTIDKDSPEVVEARKSIESVFGVQTKKSLDVKINQVTTAISELIPHDIL